MGAGALSLPTFLSPGAAAGAEQRPLIELRCLLAIALQSSEVGLIRPILWMGELKPEHGSGGSRSRSRAG